MVIIVFDFANSCTDGAVRVGGHHYEDGLLTVEGHHTDG